MSSGCEQTETQGAVKRARQAANKARLAAAAKAYRQTLVREIFAQPVRDCAYRCIGRPVDVLRAGCLTPLDEIGLDQLRKSGFEIVVATVDDARWAAKGQRARGEVIRGDLRTAAIMPRSFDIVHCSLLLDRISHAELVLDRFTAALRPGGLLLLRIRDRDCAAGLLDRLLPQWVRRALWDRLNPGRPGPFPAVYEPASSDRGIGAYVQLRGLAIVQRETAKTPPAVASRAGQAVSAAHSLISRLTRNRLTDAHEEVLYVIRKPEDRLARIL
jgi:SAM-dependent methyltransferase